jgi:hypothetical protein
MHMAASSLCRTDAQVRGCGTDGCNALSFLLVVVLLLSVATFFVAVLRECVILFRAHVELQPAFHADALLFFGDNRDGDRSPVKRRCASMLRGASVHVGCGDWVKASRVVDIPSASTVCFPCAAPPARWTTSKGATTSCTCTKRRASAWHWMACRVAA